MAIDYDRLLPIVTGDIHPDLRDSYDIQSIVNNATEENGLIIVRHADFKFAYDANTYEQAGMAGGGPQ